MDIFSALNLVGGLALFLYGMSLMGNNLEKMAGGKLEKILEKLTSRKFMAVLLGVVVTAIIQSSSATTVMVVGFVNSGIMALKQAIGVIMGANIGTTITSWILSLTGIQGDSLLVKLLKPANFSPVFAVLGIIMIMSGKDDKKKDVGNIFLGFSILMFGMTSMSDAVSGLSENETFVSILTLFHNPLLGMAAGALVTAIIQSSSASVGILQALCLTGSINYAIALPIIMGQNIGTCITSLLSSIGASKNAKRAALIHLYFNMIGTILFMAVFYGVNSFAHFAFLNDACTPLGIAVIHSLFNIVTVIVLYPFDKVLLKLAELTIKDKGEEKKENFEYTLDERLLDTPAFAMERCRTITSSMALKTGEIIGMSLKQIENYSNERYEQIKKLEDEIDKYEDYISAFLVKLSSKNISNNDSKTMSIILHSINDFERMSDHAFNINRIMKDMSKKKLVFSDYAKKDLKVMCSALTDITTRTVNIFIREDESAARTIEPLEEIIDKLNKEAKQKHIIRLREGKCTIELGLLLEDLITNIERISDHCSNVGIAIIEIRTDDYGAHEYIKHLNKEEGSFFHEEYLALEKEYQLEK